MPEHRGIKDIGGTEHDWLRVKHDFALGSYGNPTHKRIGCIAVRYENRLQTEAFKDSEIVLVVSAGRYHQ